MIQPKFLSLDPEYVSQVSETALTSGAIDLAAGNSMENMPVELATYFKNLPEQDILRPFAPANGLMSLRDAIARKTALLYGHGYCAGDEISITTGANQALFASMSAFLEEGDEVILFEPANENYLPIILLCGARPVYISLKEPDFHVDWEAVTRMVTAKTKMIIINSPHNPTGMVFNELDMLRLQKVINGTRIIVLSDERYEHIVFDGTSHQSVALYPQLVERSILVSSLSETCRASWPVGYCAAPAKMMKKVRQILQVLHSGHFAPFQMALAEIIENPDVYKQVGNYYQAKRDYFNGKIINNTRLIPIPTQGTYFQLFSYEMISEDRDREFIEKMLHHTGVAAVPYSLFFHEKQKNPWIRFNFARPVDILDSAISRLSRL
ncbi:aminotransferase class I/II-fold pyridoxal phosphate-dependent enzyme [Natronoflexus pectinivorans]|uniref:Methionine aminotransferase n=1 Tax=Natronoflexus pectinivorans TaxID=682526 RepID=A0A4R2GIQ5_9BACT|nr:aminotransferase class I/II-fold pyridoxal phosphate-dependent enzyme [Natronoflexus pectinivorans]TCO08469.1 methionine aminotransferase [Natronoflexus pectinivorans]